MPFKLEHFNDKAIVVNTLTGKHYSNSPIALHDAEKQMRILEQYRTMKQGLREPEVAPNTTGYRGRDKK